MHRNFSLKVLTVLIPCLVVIGAQVQAATISESGNQNITAIVPGPPPSTPAVITSPTGNLDASVTPIVVSGSCGPGLLVKLFNNGVLIGTTTCALDGTFTINATLNFGVNALTVLNYDTLDQAGPASPAIVVTVSQPSQAASPTSPNSKPRPGSANQQKPGAEQPGEQPQTPQPNSGILPPSVVATLSYVKAKWIPMFVATLSLAGLYLFFKPRFNKTKSIELDSSPPEDRPSDINNPK